MKIAHVTEYCHAGSTGGTERYIHDLALGLNHLGRDNEIIWMTPSPVPPDRFGGEIPIRNLPRSDMRVDDPPLELDRLVREWLSGPNKPDLLHFHTFGRSEAVLAEAATGHHVPYVFTYHSPAWSCRRETLLRWGKEVCDGEVLTQRCAACKVQERLGGPAWLGYAGAAASRVAGPFIPKGPWHRRLAFTPDTARYRAALRHFLNKCALSVACAEWSIPVLLVNGVRRENLLHLPQGVPVGFTTVTGAPPPSDTFTIGSIGRMNEVKGLHILIEAFRRLTHPPARLRVCGWSDTPQLAVYGRLLKRLAGDDARIAFIPEQSPSDMQAEYARLSLLAIPSVWMETGPLTLLEALQSGVPVYGSSHIGQRALLERYGKVIEPNTPDAWALALSDACRMYEQDRWSRVILAEPLPTMASVAARMDRAYRELLAS